MYANRTPHAVPHLHASGENFTEVLQRGQESRRRAEGQSVQGCCRGCQVFSQKLHQACDVERASLPATLL